MNWMTLRGLQLFFLLRKFRFVFIIGILTVVPFSVSPISLNDHTNRIELSSEETAWLNAHPVIWHAPDPDYAPFEFRNKDDEYVGIAPDFLNLVGRKLGVQFKTVPSYSWKASLDNVKQRKADLVTVATKTPERSEYMRFTPPYIEFNNVILMREDVSGNFKIIDLEGKTVAAIKGWAITTHIQKNFPDIKLHWVENVKEALTSVSNNTDDAVLLNRATAGYWTVKTDISNLRIAGETDYSYHLSFASRRDWPQLNRLLEKALNDIAESERKEIVDRWIFPFRQGWRPGPKFWIALAGAVVFLMFIGIFAWVVALRRLVQIRTVALERELTERKRAEEKLRESEERAKTLLRAIPDIMFRLDSHGVFLDYKAEKSDLHAQSVDTIIGKNNCDITPPEFADLIDQKIKQTLHSGEMQIFEYSLPIPSRGLCDYEARMVKSDKDEVIAIVRNVTKHKQMELEYRTIVRTAMDGFWLLDMQGHFLVVNDAYCHLVGYSREELLSRSIPDIEASEKPEETAARIQKIKKIGHDRFETRHRCKDGKVVDVEISVNYLPTEKGRLFVFIRDITDRKQAEQDLRESKEKYWNLFNMESDALALVEKETGNMLDANRAFIELYGYSREEILKMKNIDFSEEPELTKQETMSPIPAHIPIRYHKKKDGTIFPTEITTSIFSYRGKDVIIAAIRDISDREHLENSLRQAHKMEAIGTLSGGIAHEFNNILGIIIGNTELAIGDVPEWNPAKDCLEEIRIASLRAKDVVRQIMSFARKTQTEQKPIDISAIIIESLKLIRSTMPTSIKIRQEILCDSEMIFGNSTEISQILLNLCRNSIQAMADETGILEVWLEPVTLNDSMAISYKDISAGEYVKLTVKDTGSGIDPKIMERILDPYFTTKDVDQGLGMGLAVVSGLVKKHNGVIKFTSAIRKGTTVEVLFPVTKEKAKTEVKKDGELPKGTERILVVDDEVSLVEIFTKVLERQGYQVVGKTNSIEALNLFQTDSAQFDLVITDMAMPDMTGDRFAQELIKMRPDIPVIICTGHSDRIDEDNAKDLGISEYVMKPIKIGKFSKTVREILDKTKS